MSDVSTALNFYRPRHFKPAELVSQKAFQQLGENRVLRYIDPRILMMADALADRFCLDEEGQKIGTATINNWSFGGNLQYRGLRLPGDPHFKQFSDHSFGRALDITFSTTPAAEVRDHIEKHPELYPFITFVEEGDSVTWLHIGCGNLAGMGFTIKQKDSVIFYDIDMKCAREIFRKAGGNV